MQKNYIFILFLSFLLPSCTAEKNNKLYVVCTTSMITDAVKQIGGEHVEVDGLMGPGIDPHVYRARAGDIDKLSRAEIIFFNGLHLEGKMGQLFEQMTNKKPTVAVGSGIEKSKLRESEFAGLYDPHIWHDVQLWQYAVDAVENALSTIDPQHAQEYRINAQNYKSTLNELEQWIREKIKIIPVQKKILVTAHDAFEYFGAAYGFTVVGLQGISTDSEVGTRDIQELADFIVEHKVPTLFIESSIPQRNIKAVQKAVESRGWQVRIGQELFSDALGDVESKADTYSTMIQHNVRAIVQGLKEKNEQTASCN